MFVPVKKRFGGVAFAQSGKLADNRIRIQLEKRSWLKKTKHTGRPPGRTRRTNSRAARRTRERPLRNYAALLARSPTHTVTKTRRHRTKRVPRPSTPHTTRSCVPHH